MTSSLVGSEMCIRDRSTTSSPSSLRVCPPRPGQPRPTRPPAPERTRPVSYTHLTLPTICSV
eukprot:11026424-Prorocentrum_lima.AAC.1